MTTFMQTYPFLQNQPISVSFARMDAAKGFAVGTLSVLNGSVPIIINNFQVQPMDVILYPEFVTPINEYILGELMRKQDAFAGLGNASKKITDGLFTQSNFPQYAPIAEGHAGGGVGRYESRPAVKVASVLDELELYPRSAVEKIASLIEDDEQLALAFEQNGMLDQLEKLASKVVDDKATLTHAIVSNLPVDRQYVYRDAQGKNMLKQANSQYEGVWTVALDADELANYNNIFNTEKVAASEITEAKPFTAIESLIEPGTAYLIDSEGHYRSVTGTEMLTKSAGFSPKELYAEPNDESMGMFVVGDKAVSRVGLITGFHGPAEGSEKVAYAILPLATDKDSALLVTPNGEYAKVTGADQVMDKYASFDVEELKKRPNIGDEGIFVYKGAALNTPALISNAIFDTKLNSGNSFYEMFDGIKKIAFYPVQSQKVSTVVPHDTEKNAFWIPEGAYFVPITKNDKNLAKTASARTYDFYDGKSKYKFGLTPALDEDVVKTAADNSITWLPITAKWVNVGKLSKNVGVDTEKVAEYSEPH